MVISASGGDQPTPVVPRLPLEPDTEALQFNAGILIGAVAIRIGLTDCAVKERAPFGRQRLCSAPGSADTPTDLGVERIPQCSERSVTARVALGHGVAQ